MARAQIPALVVSLCLLPFVLERVRRKRLQEQYSLLWIAGSLGLLVLSAWPGLLDRTAPVLGIAYPPAALFLGGLFLLVLLCLHFSLAISKLARQNRILAQKLGRMEADKPSDNPKI